MFTPARYVAIDDNADELAPLVHALHAIGAPCIGFRFDPPLGLPTEGLFAGLRILFSDLHLLSGAPAGNQQYDTLCTILERGIPQSHGPYLLILWTSHEQEREDFASRLKNLLPVSKWPLAVLALDKKAFSLGVGLWNGSALQTAVTQHISSMPQLKALLGWERDVLAAANSTLALVSDLIPSEKRNFEDYPAAIDRTLSQLAEAAAGKPNAKKNPKSAVTAALSPLLTDRILNQPADPADDQMWTSAVTFQDDSSQLSDTDKAKMNAMLHVATAPNERLAQTDWGAVIPLDANQLSDEMMKRRFGVTASDLRDREFKLKADNREEGILVVIRGGAACDQAQASPGPLPLLLGLLAPESALQKNNTLHGRS